MHPRPLPSQRVLVTVLGFYMMLQAISTDLYLPSLPGLALHPRVDRLASGRHRRCGRLAGDHGQRLHDDDPVVGQRLP